MYFYNKEIETCIDMIRNPCMHEEIKQCMHYNYAHEHEYSHAHEREHANCHHGLTANTTLLRYFTSSLLKASSK